MAQISIDLVRSGGLLAPAGRPVMHKPHFTALAIATAVSLGACQTLRDVVEDPIVVQASEAGITYRFSEGLFDDTREAANKHCRRYNRSSQLDRVIPGEGNDRTAIFRCF